MKKKYVISITGPSGCGKSTCEIKMTDSIIKGFRFKSTTTRSQRINDAIDAYFYVSTEHFETLLKNNLLVEHTLFNGNYYGLENTQIENFIKDESSIFATAVFEVKGVEQINEKIKQFPNVELFKVYIDISKDTQIERMLKRGDSLEYAQNRVENETIAKDFEKNKDLFDLIIPESLNLNAEQTVSLIMYKLIEFMHKKSEEIASKEEVQQALVWFESKDINAYEEDGKIFIICDNEDENEVEISSGEIIHRASLEIEDED